MKNLNDGTLHSIEEIEEIGRKLSASQFSEGNETLKQLLMSLWDLNIKTLACCKGTHDKEHNVGIFKAPYILMSITPETKNNVLKLIEYITNENGSSKPNIVFKNIIIKNENHHVVILEHMFLSNRSAEHMFKLTLNALERMKKEEKIKPNKTIKASLDLINHFTMREISNKRICEINVKISNKNQTTFKVKSINNKNLKITFTENELEKVKEFCDEFTTPISNLSFE